MARLTAEIINGQRVVSVETEEELSINSATFLCVEKVTSR